MNLKLCLKNSSDRFGSGQIMPLKSRHCLDGLEFPGTDPNDAEMNRRLSQNLQDLTSQTQPQPQHHQKQIPSNRETISLSSELCATQSLPAPSNWCRHIRKCISQRAYRDALVIYTRIRHPGINLSGVLPLLLKACSSLAMLNHGKALHAESVKMGMESDVMVGTSLIDMYAKCGRVFDSRKVFDNMPERNVVTWNAMIGGCLKSGDISLASFLFKHMSTRSAVTWIEMIEGFARRGDADIARKFFDQVPLELRTVVTWTVMVDGYARNGDMEAANEVFEQMPERNYFVWSSLISGYCKKGDVQAAMAIFNRIPERNLVNWNSLITGLAQNGCCEEALDVFKKMQAEGFEPDEVTIASVLSACGQIGLLDTGKEVHQMIVNKGVKINQFVLNGLVDMYAKCGDLRSAKLIFERMTERNDACWNAMISGLAIHGQCNEALDFLRRMEASNEKPNGITFLSVLSACAHRGFVEKGLEIFSKMEKYGLKASIKHYGCIIDLLGRAGRLKEAYDLIKRMPVKANDTVWGALLGACRIHSDTDMADQVVKQVARDSDPEYSHDSHYVLLSNIYAASDSWEKAERMRMVMLDKGFQKTTGHSWFTSFSAATT